MLELKVIKWYDGKMLPPLSFYSLPHSLQCGPRRLILVAAMTRRPPMNDHGGRGRRRDDGDNVNPTRHQR